MLLDLLANHAQTAKVAYIYDDGKQRLEYTYRQLAEESDRIASFLLAQGEARIPVIVYGHKHPRMLAAFLGCVKAGRAYCPLDISMPEDRIQKIIDIVNPDVIFAIEPLSMDDPRILSDAQMTEILSSQAVTNSSDDRVKGSDLYYIIYTSGSTGEPKGVMITYDNLNRYYEWIVTIAQVQDDTVIINQAPFSFDLSVMDLYIGLGSGSTIYALDKQIQSDYASLFQKLQESDAQIIVSTPSFADLCLADRSFSQALMPKLRTFLFCGEVLAHKTAKRLRERFPEARVINTYGPTESTVCVTEIEITDEILNTYDPLPIGTPKPGTHFLFREGDTLNEESGEIVILGDTVSPGYFRLPEQTKAAFQTIEYQGNQYQGYYTGDLGEKRGSHYFCSGRNDSQIKMHGYRIELGDIESNLQKIESVRQACVLPHYVKGKVQRLTAYIVYKDTLEIDMEITRELKHELARYIQPYMIPQRFVYLDSLPMNQNGKIDRKALMEQQR